MIASTILAFFASAYENFDLATASGCCGVIAFGLLQLASFAARESIERTESLNKILRRFGLDEVPIPSNDIDMQVIRTLHNESRNGRKRPETNIHNLRRNRVKPTPPTTRKPATGIRKGGVSRVMVRDLGRDELYIEEDNQVSSSKN